MERVISCQKADIKALELEINKKIVKLRNLGHVILNVKFAGRSDGYSKEWGALIVFDDRK